MPRKWYRNNQFDAGVTTSPVAQVDRNAMPQIRATIRNNFPRESTWTRRGFSGQADISTAPEEAVN
jgi:hypothetical protein